MSPAEHERIVRRVIEGFGHATQSLGVGRVIGQIYAYLYLNPDPRSLDDLTTALGISKGSASMGVRQLEQWGAVERVWVRGDRRDYYRARDAFGRILKSAVADLAGRRIEAAAGLLAEVEEELQRRTPNGRRPSPGDEFLRERVRKIRSFQSRAQRMWGDVILRLLLHGDEATGGKTSNGGRR